MPAHIGSRSEVTNPRPAQPALRAVRNERGIALLIVLIVVALLTVTVTEFTYSVQIDQHRVRNAIHALQAQLLARSGVNLAEGFLMLDESKDCDSYTEPWWIDLIQFCDGVKLDESTIMRCRVRDESGKININNTKGTPLRRGQAQAVTKDMVLRDALRCLFEPLEIEVDIVDKLADYWQQEPTQRADGTQVEVPQFSSLEDFGATFGIPVEQLEKLRPFVTAQPRYLLRSININTAPVQVLSAVLTDQAGQGCGASQAVEDILSRRSEATPDQPCSRDLLNLIKDVDNAGAKKQLFGANSSLYRLEASALTNIDPEDPTGGGIGQTLSTLVRRYVDNRPRPQGPQVGADGRPLPNWTLRPLDWQKEGGARLFRHVPGDEDLPGNPEDEDEDMEDDERLNG
jgi:general secretion pathway protein K